MTPAWVLPLGLCHAPVPIILAFGCYEPHFFGGKIMEGPAVVQACAEAQGRSRVGEGPFIFSEGNSRALTHS